MLRRRVRHRRLLRVRRLRVWLLRSANRPARSHHVTCGVVLWQFLWRLGRRLDRMPAALSSEAFTEAFARHGRALWVIASAWVGRSEADDLVQETARVAWQQRAQFDCGTDAGPWLSTIARNLGSNWRRKKKPESRSPDELPEAVAATIAAADWPFDVDRAGLSDGLANALADLSEAARACLLLHVVIGLSFAEIAAMLAIPENTAMSHARRARQFLRASLSQPKPSNASPQPNR